MWPLLLALAGDVGEIALVEDVGGQIQDSVLIGSRYLERTSCAFYQTHEDRYDAIFVFTSIPLNGFTRTQEGWALRKAAEGIGRTGWPDTSDRFCATRLRHAIKMGDIGSFDDDPDAIYTAANSFTLSGVELMGHEFGHYCLAAVTFDRGDGIRRCRLRGFNDPGETPMNTDCDGYRNSDFNQHWSYFFNTGSVMYGNTIEDLGNGDFRLTNPSTKYSDLDQYLLGLRDPSEVSPMFLVDVGPPSFESLNYPVPRGTSVIVQGERLDFTVEDVIRAEGARVPAIDPCHWKAAFIIVHGENAPPTQAEIDRVDRYRRRWEEFYPQATDGRGSFDTTLAGTGLGTDGCPATIDPGTDAGIVFSDADTLDASDEEPDASSPDAMIEDAGSIDETPPMTASDAGDGVKVLHLDDCDCTTANGGPIALWILALLIFRRSR
jgi:hypothetical protein